MIVIDRWSVAIAAIGTRNFDDGNRKERASSPFKQLCQPSAAVLRRATQHPAFRRIVLITAYQIPAAACHDLPSKPCGKAAPARNAP
jgi:hypothetical protein